MGKLGEIFAQMLKQRAVEIRGTKAELRSMQSRLLKFSANKGRRARTRTVGRSMFAWIERRNNARKR